MPKSLAIWNPNPLAIWNGSDSNHCDFSCDFYTHVGCGSTGALRLQIAWLCCDSKWLQIQFLLFGHLLFDNNKVVLGEARVSFVWRACVHALAMQLSHTPVPFPPHWKCPRYTQQPNRQKVQISRIDPNLACIWTLIGQIFGSRFFGCMSWFDVSGLSNDLLVTTLVPRSLLGTAWRTGPLWLIWLDNQGTRNSNAWRKLILAVWPQVRPTPLRQHRYQEGNRGVLGIPNAWLRAANR